MAAIQETCSNMDLRIKKHGEETELTITKSLDEFGARLTQQQAEIRDGAAKLADHRKRLEAQ